MHTPCVIKDQPVQPVLAVRTRAAVQDLPAVLGRIYGQVAHYLGSLGEPVAGPPYVAYYNMDMQDLDIEAGFPVNEPLNGKDEIQPGMIPAGQAVSTVYSGPYSGMTPAYEALMAFMREQGLQATGVAYEIYIDDPAMTPPELMKTEIVFPLKST